MSDRVGAALDKWVTLRGSGTLTTQERADVRRAVLDRGERAPTLYRGANIPFNPRSYGRGKPIDFAAVATSEEIGSAEPYALNGDDQPVVFRFLTPKGLRVSDRAEDVSGYSEGEWITAGRQYVRTVAREPDGTYVVTVAPAPPGDEDAQKRAGTKPIKLGEFG